MMSPDAFYELVTTDRRFSLPPEAIAFLDRIIFLLGEGVLEKDKVLFRAQLGGDFMEDCNLDENQEIQGVQAFPAKRMFPDADKCKDGQRFSIEGMPALYFSSKKETAIKEMRPWRGAELSVATLSTKKRFKMAMAKDVKWGIFDELKQGYADESMQDKKLMAYVYRWFSSPVTGVNSKHDNVVTQIIAERVRLEGFDGIIYESAVDSKNISGVLFCPPKKNPQKYFPSVIKFHRCDMQCVESMDMKLDESYDADPTVFSVKGK